MDIRKRVYGPLALTHSAQVVGIDLPEFLRRLLLFEGVVLYSRFKEIGMLVRSHGLDITLALLTASGVEVVSDPAAIGKVGKHEVTRSRNGMLRVGRLNFGIIRAANPEQWMDRSFADLRKVSELSPGRANKLENTIRGRLKPLSASAREVPFETSKLDFVTVAPIVRKAIEVALQKHCASLPPAGGYTLSIEHRAAGYVVETDLHRRLRLDDGAVGEAIAAGLLGAAGLNCVIDDMRVQNALVGLPDGELAVLEAKLDFLAQKMDPGQQAHRLERVVALTSLPSIGHQAEFGKVDVRRLLDVRRTPECIAFRDWLWSSATVSDDEIQHQFHGLRQRLGTLARNDSGKGLGWAVGTGIGFVPLVGPAVSVAVGLLDTFLTERVLPGRGALTFLGEQYKSIFAP